MAKRRWRTLKRKLAARYSAEASMTFEVGQRVDPWGHPVPDEPQAGGGTCTITGIDRDSGAITLRKGAP